MHRISHISIIMDSELVKDRMTDVTLSTRLPRVGELLMYLRCTSLKHNEDPVLVELKQRLVERLRPCENFVLSRNIPRSALEFILRALYHACVTPPRPRENLATLLKDIVLDWQRCCYMDLPSCDGVEEEEETLLRHFYDRFAYVYSYICISPGQCESSPGGFICPSCVVDYVFSDIGWVDFVCPQPFSEGGVNEIQRAISKRGADSPDLPLGYCRHLLSLHNTTFDAVLYDASTRI